MGDDDPEDDLCGPRDYVTPHHYAWLTRALKAIARAVALAEKTSVLPPPTPGIVEPLPPLPTLIPLVVPPRIRLGEDGWNWPVERCADGRPPVISDGRHAKGDMKFRGGAGHRGVDIMFRKRVTLSKGAALNHPWESRGHEVLPRTHAVAAGPGRVTVARWLATGYAVSMDHGFGVETAYHHLAGLLCKVGDEMRSGDWVGVVGCPPAAVKGGKPGLVHLHFDLLIGGKFVDSEPYLKTWPVAPLKHPTIPPLLSS